MTGASERCLIFDPFAGIAGDMIVGALIDVGLSPEWLESTVAALSLGAEVEVQQVERGAIAAVSVKVHAPRDDPHRQLSDILAIIADAQIPPRARETAGAVFRRLAEAEGAVHGIEPERVHFHEVGAVDAIVDIVAVAAGVAELGIARCFTRPVAIGSGWVQAEHGALPIPAPAALKLLEGLPTHASMLEGELTTPTGAALLSQLTQGRPPPGAFVPVRSGFGAGSRNPDTHPNCLRVVLAEVTAEEAGWIVLQADIDDMSPEYVAPLYEALMGAGAVDVWSHPIQMKKGRGGVRIEALVPRELRPAVTAALFAHTTTLGVRYHPIERQVLPRSSDMIEWRGFPIRVKISRTPAGHVRRKPEYEDVYRAAGELGIPPLEARDEIERALQRADLSGL